MQRISKYRHQRKKPVEPYRVNHRIEAAKVRLVGEGIPAGIYPLEKALSIAQEKGLDLVEIFSKTDIPVCKVINYAKFKYQKKREKRLREKANKVVTKEIRLASNIGAHDFEFKKKHAINFLTTGAQVKIAIHLKRGRAFYVSQDIAKQNLTKLIEVLASYGGKVKQPIKLIGRQMFTIIEPGKSIPKPNPSNA